MDVEEFYRPRVAAQREDSAQSGSTSPSIDHLRTLDRRTEVRDPALRWTTLNAACGNSIRRISKGRQKTGRRFGVHENAKAIERSKGDVVVLIACENITFRILLQHRRGRPARLDS